MKYSIDYMKQLLLVSIATVGIFCMFVQPALATEFRKGFNAAAQKTGLYTNADAATVFNVTIQWVLTLVAGLAILAIVYAGVRLIVGTGEEAQMAAAKKILFWAIAGLTVTIFSWVIVRIVFKEVVR